MVKVGHLVLGSALLATSACGFQDDSKLGSDEQGLEADIPYLAGNPTCADLGYAYEVKFDFSPAAVPGESHTVTFGGGSVTFTFEVNGTWSWTSTIGIDAVLMKASTGAYLYAYNPEATSGNNLLTPYTSNNTGANRADLSHINFCYDYEVVVDKTASTSFKRDHTWSIQKTAAETTLLLSLAQQYLLGFTVTVTSSATDSNWKVGGTITVSNPDPTYPAKISSITDNLSGIGDIAVDCGEGVTFPITLAPGASIVCSYLSNVLPDSSARTNTGTATAASDSKVGGGSDSVAVTFSSDPGADNTTDGCVDVTDTHQGSLGQVCASDGTKTFTYTVPLEFETCGPSTLTNTASFTSTSSTETGSSTVVVSIDVPCTGGCTLTQGYWKTHSINGPAKYDATWNGQEDDAFFSSGQTWYEVLWTPPAGNVYYVLAHQYIAATLNIQNGASTTAAIDAALADAAAKLASTTVDAAKKFKTAQKQAWTTLAFTLDQYNNGITGPGHCSE
jgi:hypothetical protein